MKSTVNNLDTMSQHNLQAIIKQQQEQLAMMLSQIRYSLVVILELNGVSEVQYKDVMMIDNGKYQ